MATPLIIGAGIFVATTGLLMFFVTVDPFRFAHEIVGVGFAVGIVLHILSNWRPFTRYFSQKSAAGIIALGWVVGISLVTTSAIRGEEDAEDRVVDQIEQTSIQLLAPVVGMEVGALADRRTTVWLSIILKCLSSNSLIGTGQIPRIYCSWYFDDNRDGRRLFPNTEDPDIQVVDSAYGIIELNQPILS